MSDPAFTIRPATAAAGVLACLAEAFAPYRARYTPEGFRDTVLTAATFERRLAGMTVLVAVDGDGAVIGTIGHGTAGAGEGHIRGMAVRPGLQGRGVAAALLAAAEEGMRRAGCTRATLDTTTPLERAIAFYDRHGYRATGRVADFFGMPLHEYEKPLT